MPTPSCQGVMCTGVRKPSVVVARSAHRVSRFRTQGLKRAHFPLSTVYYLLYCLLIPAAAARSFSWVAVGRIVEFTGEAALARWPRMRSHMHEEVFGRSCPAAPGRGGAGGGESELINWKISALAPTRHAAGMGSSRVEALRLGDESPLCRGRTDFLRGLPPERFHDRGFRPGSDAQVPPSSCGFGPARRAGR